jgi:acetyl-CoA acyltransferase 2
MTASVPAREIVFLSGARTGFGTFGGTLKDFSATDLGVFAGKGALARSGVEPGEVDHVVFGNVLQTSADAIYLARHIGLRVGAPIETPAVTVNRLCGSGFEAIANAAQQIVLGESEVVLAGGTESMSQAPHVVRGARWGLRLGPAAPLEDSLWEALRDPSCGLSMAETAEKLAEQYRISRHAVDCYAARSQACAAEAWKSGAFQDEVIPVPVQNRKTKQTESWAADEHLRPSTTLEGLLASSRFAAQRKLRPLGRLIAWASAGVDPSIMGIGPAPAARKALSRAGLKLEDMDLVEVNEAFAAQYLAVEQELGLDRERTNVEGGAIAIGHPLGASGARITLHLLHALRRRGGRYGLGSACIGGGQGAAVVVEAFSS